VAIFCHFDASVSVSGTAGSTLARMRIASLFGSHVTLTRSGVLVDGFTTPSAARPSWKSVPSAPHSYAARAEAVLRENARTTTISWDAVTRFTVRV